MTSIYEKADKLDWEWSFEDRKFIKKSRDIFVPIRRYINRNNAERIEYWTKVIRIRPLTLMARARLQRTGEESAVHWSTFARKALKGRLKYDI